MPKKKTFCTIDACGKPCVGGGMCRAHYSRWHKYGDPRKMKKAYRVPSACSVSGCPLTPIAKGLCQNHYALMKRHGEPVRKKIFTGIYIKDGYRYVMVGARHYEPEHRLVMERFLGRKLLTEEQVHHIDRDTLNNSPSNLQVLSRSEHLKIHRPTIPGKYWPRKSTRHPYSGT